MANFFEKLYTVVDKTGAIPSRVLNYINENFKLLEMTLQGNLGDDNINDLGGNKITSVVASKYIQIGSDSTYAEGYDPSEALAAAESAQEAADGQIQGFFQVSAPTTGMAFGDIWIDTDGHTPPTTADVYRYEDPDHGSRGALAWRATPTNAIGKIYLDAYNAQATANSKIVTFYQDSQPTASEVGDLWIDTNDDNRPYRWSGTAWVDARDQSFLSAGMGVDDNCTALFHFSNSLNSHKGFTPTFARTSVAYLSDGTQIASGTPCFDVGKFGNGLLVEEGTTNLLTNPFFVTDSNSDGLADNWAVDGNNKITTQIYDHTGWGGKAQKLVINDPSYEYTTFALTQTIAGMAGKTLALRAKGKTNKTSIGLRAYDATNAANIFSQSWAITQGNDWDVSKVFTVPPGCNSMTIYIWISQEGSWSSQDYLDTYAVQLEEKGNATAITTGTRAADSISFSPSGIIDPTQGTIAVWVKPETLGKYGVILETCGANKNALWLNRSTNNTINFLYGDNASGITLYSDVILSTTAYTFVVATWSSTTGAKLYVNGELSSSNSTPAVIINDATGGIGCYGLGTGYEFDGTLDELRIDKVVRTADEIASWYKAQSPFYSAQEMMTLPGYVKAETDGFKVYDSTNSLRVLLGSWLAGAIRKYGLKIIGGEIYSSIMRSGSETDTTYIQFTPPNKLEVYSGGVLCLKIDASAGGEIVFYNGGNATGKISTAVTGGNPTITAISPAIKTVVDSNLECNGYVNTLGAFQVDGSTGCTGSFIAGIHTVYVEGGIITSII